MSRRFREPPTSVALHPSGLYVLVVFPSGQIGLALLEDEASDVAEVEALGTSHVSFARGGHFFASSEQFGGDGL